MARGIQAAGMVRYSGMNSSNEDKAEGAVKQAVGKVKEVVGNAVGNPRVEAEGTAEKTEGKVQSKVGDVKKVFEK